MTQAVVQEAAEVDRMRDLINQRRLQAARFLHGTIQGELVAAGLRHDHPEQVSEILRRRFEEYGSTTTRSAGQQVGDVIDAWSAILEMSTTIDESCWPRLIDSPERTHLLVDALSEALTNVVRHAADKFVNIQITAHQNQIRLTVQSCGPASSTSQSGIGLAQLRERGADVDLRTAGNDVILTVDL